MNKFILGFVLGVLYMNFYSGASDVPLPGGARSIWASLSPKGSRTIWASKSAPSDEALEALTPEEKAMIAELSGE